MNIKNSLKYLSAIVIMIVLFLFFNNEVLAQPPLKIISRAEWGANEDFRFCKWWDKANKKCGEVDRNEEVWPREYAPIKKIIVHETDGSDSLDENKPGDYLVRNIYRWHAITLGWGDIGYNYLIDSQGNIYEGRAGGDGVIAGHTFHTYCVKRNKKRKSCKLSSGDTKVGYNFNSGSIGISVMGNFKSKKPTAAQKAALTQLIAKKSAEFNLDPSQAVEWKIPLTLKTNEKEITSGMPQARQNELRDDIKHSLSLIKSKGFGYTLHLDDIENPYITLTGVRNVVTHKDVDWTLDPPQNLYSMFMQARQLAKVDYNELKLVKKTYKAELISQRAQKIDLKPGAAKNIKITYRNNGNFTWHSFSDNALILAEKDIKQDLGSLGLFNTASIKSAYPGEQYKAENKNIAPGQTATFTVPIYPPLNATSTTIIYVLALNNKGWFPESEVSITVNNIEQDYIAKLENHTLPVAVKNNAAYAVEFRYKNTGVKKWVKDNLFLKIYDQGLRQSNFANSEWPASSIGLIQMKEKEVNIGDIATFQFKIQAKKPGIFNEVFELMRRNNSNPILPPSEQPITMIAGSRKILSIRSDSPWRAKVLEQNFPVALLPGWRPDIKIKIKNNGDKTWGRKTMLKIANTDAGEFYDKRDWIDKNTPAYMIERSAAPDQVGTFLFKLNTPNKGGVFNLNFKLEYQGQEIYFDKNLIKSIRVDSAPKKQESNKSITQNNTAKKEKTSDPTVTTYQYYTVKSGDSLIGIGAQLGVDYKNIIELNKTTYSRIVKGFLRTGWKLKVKKTVIKAETEKYYTVKSGDTILGIAYKQGTAYSKLLSLNKDQYPRITAGFLKIGWKLRVK